MSTPVGGPVFTLATGPVGSTPATLAALAQPILHHTDPAFRDLYAETVALLREAFETCCDPVIFPGEAVVGIEATAAAMIGPDDVLLNLVSGIYGRVFGHSGGGMPATSSRLRRLTAARSRPPPSARRSRGRPDITIVSAVHCETPSGTLNDLGAIGEMAARSGALLIVDAVSSFGGAPTDFEESPGVAVAAPQKASAAPPASRCCTSARTPGSTSPPTRTRRAGRHCPSSTGATRTVRTGRSRSRRRSRRSTRSARAAPVPGRGAGDVLDGTGGQPARCGPGCRRSA